MYILIITLLIVKADFKHPELILSKRAETLFGPEGINV